MNAPSFFAACRTGDVAALRAMLDQEPSLAQARDAGGNTGLHAGTAHPEVLRLLLERGADPNARETGDNASALHFAAAHHAIESVRVLLDGGADPQGAGDLHDGDVIGWAIGDGRDAARDVVALLIERGARHHIFSAVALDDQDLVRKLVAENPQALTRRRSLFEAHQTPLQFALKAPSGLGAKRAQYDMARLLIRLGADINAEDDRGKTALETALLHGDLDAAQLLLSAGAKEPVFADSGLPDGGLGALSGSIQKLVPSLTVKDLDAAVAWYTSVGFSLWSRHPEEGPMDWAMVAFGKVQIMLSPWGDPVSLWIYTDRVDELYQLFRARQLKAMHTALKGGPTPATRFEEDLYDPFYGGRQFSVRDPNGQGLIFYQEQV